MSIDPLQPKQAIKLRAIVSLAVAALVGGVATANNYATKGDSTSAATGSSPVPSIASSTLSSASASPSPTPAPSNAPTPKPATPTPARGTYRNGTYTATGSYTTSEGTERISITLSVAGDVVTATSAQNLGQDHDSRSYQSQFISAYRASVVGKPLSTLALGRVAGASLTPKGFNDAVAQIRSQAL